MILRNITIVGAVSLFLAGSGAGFGIAAAEESGPSLQERAQNPIASLISVPFQWTFLFPKRPRHGGGS